MGGGGGCCELASKGVHPPFFIPNDEMSYC
jgi:hypothetical protein